MISLLMAPGVKKDEAVSSPWAFCLLQRASHSGRSDVCIMCHDSMNVMPHIRGWAKVEGVDVDDPGPQGQWWCFHWKSSISVWVGAPLVLGGLLPHGTHSRRCVCGGNRRECSVKYPASHEGTRKKKETANPCARLTLVASLVQLFAGLRSSKSRHWRLVAADLAPWKPRMVSIAPT